MPATATVKKNPAKSAGAQPDLTTFAKIVKRATPDKDAPPPIGSLKKGGTYRVTHGAVSIAVPIEQRLNPDGTENEHLPKQIKAMPGDEVELNDADAERLLAAGVIEPLDTPARLSKVGAVWAPPKVVRNINSNAR